MKRVRGVLFDLDGTLLDSAPDLVGSLNHVRESEGLGALPIRQMSPFATKGALGLLNAGMPPADDKSLERWRLRFLAHYAENSCRDSKPYEGVSEALEFLDRSAIPWGIVTNKVEALTLPIVASLGWAKSAACVVCGDTLSRSKPHPEPVLLACSIMNVEPGNVMFVGDDVRDVQAGQAAGTLTAAVHYGYGSDEIADLGAAADAHLHTPLDLVKWIKDSHRQSVSCGVLDG